MGSHARRRREWLRTGRARVAMLALLLVAAAPIAIVAALGADAQEPGSGPHGGYSSATDLCASCHDSHYAEAGKMMSAVTERQVCYGCHTAVRTAFGEDTIGQTSQTSVHPVPVADPVSGVQVTCGDCHTPHRSPAQDVKLLRLWNGTDFVYSPPEAPIGDAFCTSCHTSLPSLPEAFDVPEHAGYGATPHDDGVDGSSATGIDCVVCHDPHGSDDPALLVDPEVDLCTVCHTDPPTPTGAPLPDPAAPSEAPRAETSEIPPSPQADAGTGT